jgi:hypothetical protein
VARRILVIGVLAVSLAAVAAIVATATGAPARPVPAVVSASATAPAAPSLRQQLRRYLSTVQLWPAQNPLAASTHRKALTPKALRKMVPSVRAPQGYSCPIASSGATGACSAMPCGQFIGQANDAVLQSTTAVAPGLPGVAVSPSTSRGAIRAPAASSATGKCTARPPRFRQAIPIVAPSP